MQKKSKSDTFERSKQKEAEAPHNKQSVRARKKCITRILEGNGFSLEKTKMYNK